MPDTPPKLETTTDVLIAAMEHAEQFNRVMVVGFSDATQEGLILTNCDTLQRMGMMQVLEDVIGVVGDADDEC